MTLQQFNGIELFFVCRSILSINFLFTRQPFLITLMLFCSGNPHSSNFSEITAAINYTKSIFLDNEKVYWIDGKT